MSKSLNFKSNYKPTGLCDPRQVAILNTNNIKQWVLDNPDYCFGFMSPTDKKAFNYLMVKFNVHGIVYMKQEDMGDESGVGRRDEFNRSLSKIKRLGLVNSIKRTNDTCILAPSPLLKKESIRQRFSKYIPAFKFTVVAAVTVAVVPNTFPIKALIEKANKLRKETPTYNNIKTSNRKSIFSYINVRRERGEKRGFSGRKSGGYRRPARNSMPGVRPMKKERPGWTEVTYSTSTGDKSKWVEDYVEGKTDLLMRNICKQRPTSSQDRLKDIEKWRQWVKKGLITSENVDRVPSSYERYGLLNQLIELHAKRKKESR